MTNCPNCGAVITGPKCEYCDTRFDIKHAGYTAVSRLEKENEFIMQRIAINDLYIEALSAMRNYGRV